MFKLLRIGSVATLCVMIALLGNIAGCAPMTATPSATPAEKATEAPKAPATTAPATEQATPVALPTVSLVPASLQTIPCSSLIPVMPAPTPVPAGWQDCFVPNQILAIGKKEFLNTPENVTGLNLLQRLDLAPLAEAAKSREIVLTLPRFPGLPTVGDLAIDLYEVTDGRSVSKAVEDFNKQAGGEAFANPNYLISDPVPIKGSPWIPGGSPAGGGPAGAAATLFRNQWAFGQIGVPQPATSGQPEEGVRIGVFDTFPAQSAAEAVTGYTFKIEENHSTQASLSMCVKSPAHAAEINPQDPPALQPIPDHGIFAAGLVQAVAPQTKIYLYRVLDDYGAGDLATLQRALLDFALGPDYDGKPSVVNLSLGLHWYPDGNQWPSQCDNWINDYNRIQSLESTLELLRQAGAVVVAAAGNSSNNANGQTEDADIPAGWPDVIGVSASNRAGGLACFSNRADVSAPGGEGWSVAGGKCDPPFDECQGACDDYGVVSLVTERTSDTGFAYWAGTSFATPLVSGLAARLLAANSYPPQDAAGVVSNTIQSSATPLTGAVHSGPIINVSRAIQPP